METTVTVGRKRRNVQSAVQCTDGD